MQHDNTIPISAPPRNLFSHRKIRNPPICLTFCARIFLASPINNRHFAACDKATARNTPSHRHATLRNGDEEAQTSARALASNRQRVAPIGARLAGGNVLRRENGALLTHSTRARRDPAAGLRERLEWLVHCPGDEYFYHRRNEWCWKKKESVVCVAQWKRCGCVADGLRRARHLRFQVRSRAAAALTHLLA
ncbi:hypothetical protein SVAN01_02913 [Stagonosporopsis vannaccii]|nr:hypothetical protein SVAN01_02913 [Stagonosporopsis vannaccii]